MKIKYVELIEKDNIYKLNEEINGEIEGSCYNVLDIKYQCYTDCNLGISSYSAMIFFGE